MAQPGNAAVEPDSQNSRHRTTVRRDPGKGSSDLNMLAVACVCPHSYIHTIINKD